MIVGGMIISAVTLAFRIRGVILIVDMEKAKIEIIEVSAKVK